MYARYLNSSSSCLLPSCWKRSTRSLCLRCRDEVMRVTCLDVASSLALVSLSFSHSHPKTDASQSLRPEHNNSSHARALHIQMLLYAFNYSYCRWALCLTTPGLAALLTLLFGSAPFGSPSYLSRLKLYDPSQFLGLETLVHKKGNPLT